jgi:hypothetical protein
MKRFILPLFLLGLTTVSLSCRKTDIASGIPHCIYKKINENKNNPNGELGSVDEYEFQGSLVYAFSPDGRIIADGASEIWNSSCQMICTVGGFAGPMMQLCNGEYFFPTATFKRNIWTKK